MNSRFPAPPDAKPLEVLISNSTALWSVANECTRSDLATAMRERAEQFDTARDAVRELLGADREYDAALFALQEVTRNVAERGWMEVQFDALRTAGERFHRARERRVRAIEAFGVTP